jgi:hypothetical protein
MSDDYYRDQDRRYEDRQYDDRRRREDQSRRHSEMMDALRQRDYDTAMRNAAPDLYVDYLRQRDAAAASRQPEYDAESPEVLRFRESHELLMYVQQNVVDEAMRNEVTSMLLNVDLNAADASEKMASIRWFVQTVLSQENTG